MFTLIARFAFLAMTVFTSLPAFAEGKEGSLPSGGMSAWGGGMYPGMYYNPYMKSMSYSLAPGGGVGIDDPRIVPRTADHSKTTDGAQILSRRKFTAAQERRELEIIKIDLERKLQGAKSQDEREKLQVQLSDTNASIAAHDGEIASVQDKINKLSDKTWADWKGSQGYYVPTKAQLEMLATLKDSGFSCGDGEIPAVRENLSPIVSGYAGYGGTLGVSMGGGMDISAYRAMSIACLNKDGYQMKNASVSANGKLLEVTAYKRSASGKIDSSEVTANGKLVRSTVYKQNSTEETTYKDGAAIQRCENFHDKAATQGGGSKSSGSQPTAQ